MALSTGRLARLQDEHQGDAVSRPIWRETETLLTQRNLDAEAMLWLARAHVALGSTASATRLDDRLRRSGYRHPALAEANTRTEP